MQQFIRKMVSSLQNVYFFFALFLKIINFAAKF